MKEFTIKKILGTHTEHFRTDNFKSSGWSETHGTSQSSQHIFYYILCIFTLD